MSPRATSGEPFDETREGIPTHHLHARYRERFRSWLSLYNPQTAGAFRRLLLRIRPDVVNAHNIHSWLSWHTLRQARSAGCGVVFSGHDCMPVVYGKMRYIARADRDKTALRDYRLPRSYNLRHNRFRYNPLRNIAIRRAMRHAHAIAVPSQALADFYAANDLPAPTVVPNGVDLDTWTPARIEVVSKLRERYGLNGKRVILTAGRLTADKGMIQPAGGAGHFARAAAANTPVGLVIAGRGRADSPLHSATCASWLSLAAGWRARSCARHSS